MDFGGLRALDDVSLSLESGERRALIGPNGAGKTTLFHVISGLIRPSKGRILFFGGDVTKMSLHRRAALGLGRTFQITSLFFPLTVEENLLLSLKALDSTIRNISLRTIRSYKHLLSHTESLLRQAELWDKRQLPVRNLSYGEQRKLEILLALAQNPKVLLLDEPTCGLSSEEVTTMTSMIKALPRDVILLVIEHDLDVAFELTEQVTILNAGKILAEGSQEAVRGNPEVQKVYLGAAQE
jgi:branched-chain amino acid transport system ATP-binding protein